MERFFTAKKNGGGRGLGRKVPPTLSVQRLLLFSYAVMAEVMAAQHELCKSLKIPGPNLSK